MIVSAYKPIPRCLLLEYDNRRDLALSFCRVQEFYESNKPEVYGKTLKFADFTRSHMSSEGVITYFNESDGFNFSGDVFRKWLPYTLSAQEREMVAAIDLHLNTSEPFYVIGVIKGDTDTIRHELAHALYYLDEGYKTRVAKVISDIPPREMANLWRVMRELNYHDSVIVDEIQAWLSTSSRDELIGIGVVICDEIKPVISRFRSILKTFLNDYKVKL